MFTDLVAFKGCCIMHVGTRRHSDRPLLQQLRKSLPKCRSVKLKFNTFCKMDVHGATDSKHLQQFMQKKWLNTLKKKKNREKWIAPAIHSLNQVHFACQGTAVLADPLLLQQSHNHFFTGKNIHPQHS